VRCAPDAIPLLPHVLGEGVRRQIEAAGPPDAAGRLTLALTFPTFDVACGQILALGPDIEIVDPPELRAALCDLAAHVLMHLFMHQTHHRGQAHSMLSGTSTAPPQLDEFVMPSDARWRVQDVAELGWDEKVYRVSG